MISLTNRTAIITGASQGLGRTIAHAYLDAGANLVICARDGVMLETVRRELESRAGSTQVVLAQPCDVSDPAEVNHLVEMAFDHFAQIHILVNNAGVYGPLGGIEEVDWNEWTQAIAVNLFGSVLLCRALLPHFRTHQYGKIIQLSGGGATNPLPFISAYAASKAAIVRFAETLAEEVRSQHIDVNTIAPGALNTRMLDEVLTAGAEKVGAAFYARALKQKDEGGAPLERGADLAVFLASAASDGITAKLISAIWDPWDTLPEHLTDLQKTDVYTLRRIVPKDRNLDWGNS